jgi:hypothetical protein
MSGKYFDKQVQPLFDTWLDMKKQELDHQVVLYKYRIFTEIATELNMKCIPEEEYKELLERSVKNEEILNDKVKKEVEIKLDKLQTELTHQLAKKDLENSNKVVKLQEEIKFLNKRIQSFEQKDYTNDIINEKIINDNDNDNE